MPLEFAGLSDVGLCRDHNEDSLLLAPELGIFAVADGMGGHAAGEVASRIAVESLRAFFEEHAGELAGVPGEGAGDTAKEASADVSGDASGDPSGDPAGDSSQDASGDASTAPSGNSLEAVTEASSRKSKDEGEGTPAETSEDRAPEDRATEATDDDEGVFASASSNFFGAPSDDLAAELALANESAFLKESGESKDTDFGDFNTAALVEADSEVEANDDSHGYDPLSALAANAIKLANQEILSAAQSSDRAGMGTTCVLSIFQGDQARVAWVGDSRAYVLRNGQLLAATSDHSLANELIRAGRLHPDEAETFEYSNVITRALGADAGVLPDITAIDLEPGDLMLLCSDGLTGMVSDERLAEVLRDASSLSLACKQLVDEANEAGGVDNITAVLVRWQGA